mgnify:CR=1 FL=1
MCEERKMSGLWQVPGWNEYEWLCHGFTTKEWGNLALHVGGDSEEVTAKRAQLADFLGFSLDQWVCGRQIHETMIAQVGLAHRGSGAYTLESALPGTDGLVTDAPGILLACFFADCVPVFFLVPERKVVGIAHAGWRGTVGRIVEKMVETLVVLYQVDPGQILAAVGPSIGQCCYQVGRQVAEQFPQSTIEEREEGIYLNLKLANVLQLEACGIDRSRIHCTEICTCCSEQFYSYRRSGSQAGRMAAVIGINQMLP